jgi:catechol 2,3-dioxygenase-like lactoylglutathione lyase family enzyme
MLSLHHVHLMASDTEATIAFWREHFGAVVMLDAEFAGARTLIDSNPGDRWFEWLATQLERRVCTSHRRKPTLR